MSTGHDRAEALGQLAHDFSHRSVCLSPHESPACLGDKIHIRGHTTDFVQGVASMEVEHAKL